MNEYYTNAGPTLAREFTDTWEPADCNIENDGITSFEFITEQVVSKLVKGIKISNSSAMMSLSSCILKDVFEIRICELTDLFNTCLDSSMFPSSWSMGEITPIPKVNIHSKNQVNGDRLHKLNYPENYWSTACIFSFIIILMKTILIHNNMASDLKRVLLLRYLTCSKKPIVTGITNYIKQASSLTFRVRLTALTMIFFWLT